MQVRINKTLAEQELARREEVAVLAAEQDRIRRAQIENEQRWSDLARKAQLAQEQWVVVDDILSFKQAVNEVTDLKKEIANLKLRLDYQYGVNVNNLKAAYAQQFALIKVKLPPTAPEKDAFETSSEYKNRLDKYKQQQRAAETENENSIDKLKKEEKSQLAEAQLKYFGQQLRVMDPFIKRLKNLQNRKFTLPEAGVMTLELGEPDADNKWFPLRLTYNGKTWSNWWSYTDRNIAKNLYQTRTYLKAEGLFQIDEATKKSPKLSPKLTTARVIHPGINEIKEFYLDQPTIFTEIIQFENLKNDELTALETRKKAALNLK